MNVVADAEVDGPAVCLVDLMTFSLAFVSFIFFYGDREGVEGLGPP